MKILVTGSKGQLGSELNDIRNNYNQFTFDFRDVDTLDITDFNALENYFKVEKPDFIINCAAYTAVDKAETDLDKAMLINATSVKYLTTLSVQYNSRLIQVSTDYVFDGLSSKPYKESDAVNPQSAYGKTKLQGETEALQNPKSIIIRTSWLYSFYGNNFVKNMLKYTKEREMLKIVFDQTGSPTYAADLADAIMVIVTQISQNNNTNGGIYHFSNEGACSWYDFTSTIAKIANNNTCKIYPIETKEYPLPATRPQYSVMDKSKIKTDFNISIDWWCKSLEKCMAKLLA